MQQSTSYRHCNYTASSKNDNFESGIEFEIENLSGLEKEYLEEARKLEDFSRLLTFLELIWRGGNYYFFISN